MSPARSLGYGLLVLCLALGLSEGAGFGKNTGGRHNYGVIGDKPGPGETVFNVLDFGAKRNSNAPSTMQLIRAWNAACHSPANKKRLVIPAGEYLIGPVIFQGPCLGTEPIVFQLIGTLKASTDISEYDSDEWVGFERIDGLIVTGGGTFNGQGEAHWTYNDCKKNPNCQLLPSSVKFSKVSNAVVRGVTSLNSLGFHYTLYGCNNFRAKRLRIIAPDESPNTDGIHISNSTNVKISKSTIATGDDCISIGQGCTNILINKITCGPGHGISIGSLGKYKDEFDVRAIAVKNCTLSNTTNGLRIKTWPDSPPSEASGFLFQNIVMNSVLNPIIIDQEYCNKYTCVGKPGSRVKISNVYFHNIRGTSASEVAVKIVCSKSYPCRNVRLINIDLKYNGIKQLKAISTCKNAKLGYMGRQNPPPCLA